ncbi:MAG: zinc ribbon domain-containing protein [Ruminococcus sp.]|nr:zinc ribbon domain-containing protein [Ruminococcus sp.]
MFCQNCGHQVPDNSKYCPNCASPVTDGYDQQQNYQYDNGYNQLQNNQVYAVYEQSKEVVSQTWLGWYKYVIYFQFCYVGLRALGSGISLILSGIQFYVDSEYFSQLMKDTRLINIFFGILYLLLVPLVLFTSYKFIKYKADCLLFLTLILVLLLTVKILYAIASTIFTGIFVIGINTWLQIIFTAVIIVVNNIYFRKCKEIK